ncbi:MAG TPA: RNA polymerase sigma factor [Burkholderiales bacterium]|nr:RNA polymerase sigma factor [Burkholderiales bacterium]
MTKQRKRFSFAGHRARSEFEQLVSPHLDYLYKLAYRFTGATDRADDLIQDLLVRLYPRQGELARIEQLRPWLVRVMYRQFIDHMRRDARAPHMSIADSDLAGADADGDPYAEVANDAPSPELELELNLNREQLLLAWEQLSDDHKALLALYEIEGYTLAELEAMLELARGTLKSRLHRARAHLAKLLGTEPFELLERVKGKRGIHK